MYRGESEGESEGLDMQNMDVKGRGGRYSWKLNNSVLNDEMIECPQYLTAAAAAIVAGTVFSVLFFFPVYVNHISYVKKKTLLTVILIITFKKYTVYTVDQKVQQLLTCSSVYSFRQTCWYE